jgi:nucleoside-diphosphate-sugar epimerase/putative sterol carrier protein
MSKIVAVTGAGGSLGRALVERLAARDDVERIIALDRKAPHAATEKVEGRACDVRDADIADHFEGCTAVFHLAFIVERGSRDHELVQSVNVGGSQNVFRAAAAKGVGQVIYASSIAAYGAHAENLAGPLTEDAPTRGNDDFYYARTKAEVERWLDGFEASHEAMAIARMRPTIFLSRVGTRSTEMFRKRFFPHLRGGTGAVQVTHQDDVVTAFELAFAKAARGAFNVATSGALPSDQWAKAMGKLSLPIPRAAIKLMESAYERGKLDVDPIWLKFSGGYPLVVSSDKIRSQLGWKPRFETTAEVLRELADVPTLTASRGVKLVFGGLTALTRFRGNLVPPDEQGELKGLTGSLDIAFTGEHASTWHVWFDDGRVGVGKGGHPSARARVILADETFYELMSGDLDYTTATMIGKVRLRGDGEFSMIVGAIFSNLRRVLTRLERSGKPGHMFHKWFFSPRRSQGAQ